MSLLCDYSDSSASSASEDEVDTHQPSAINAAAVGEELPSVDDLFASGGPSAPNVSSALRVQQQSNRQQHSNKKRPAHVGSDDTDAKRLKGGEGQPKSSTATAALTTRSFAPPQLKRPNVSTEDRGAWNTEATMRSKQKVTK